jgi:spore coat protein U-like protein
MNRGWLSLILLTLALLVTVREARATSNCTIVSVTPCNFPNFVTTAPQLDTTGSILFNCTQNDTTVQVRITAGSGTINNRRFAGAATFNYQIYKDAARTQIFGTNTTQRLDIPSPVLGLNTVTTYCRIPPGENPAVGSYSDNPTVRLISSTTDTADHNVYATQNGSCSTSVTAHLAFGAYDPVGANATTPADATATLSVNCTNQMPYTVTAGQGANAATGSTASVPLRQMASGANRLGYFIYQNSGRTLVLGNTSATGIALVGMGSAAPTTIYGRIPAGQNKPVGTYSDTIIMTVTF